MQKLRTTQVFLFSMVGFALICTPAAGDGSVEFSQLILDISAYHRMNKANLTALELYPGDVNVEDLVQWQQATGWIEDFHFLGFVFRVHGGDSPHPPPGTYRYTPEERLASLGSGQVDYSLLDSVEFIRSGRYNIYHMTLEDPEVHAGSVVGMYSVPRPTEELLRATVELRASGERYVLEYELHLESGGVVEGSFSGKPVHTFEPLELSEARR
jgi:hypothetical protein